MNSSEIVIAVDGPAGSGKSSVSKEVAKRLGIWYIDSGAIYRAVTWYILEKHGAVERGKSYVHDIEACTIEQHFTGNGSAVTFVNDRDVSDQIRTERIAKNIGIISDDPAIRNLVNRLLREWRKRRTIIMDGRDIGTVVFPDAEIKIFLDASVDVRARRRILEYQEMGKTVDVDDISQQIIQRDKEDRSRPVGRLYKADDAITIDTSNMSREEVVQKIIGIIRNRCQTIV